MIYIILTLSISFTTDKVQTKKFLSVYIANDVKVLKGNTKQFLKRIKYSYRNFNKRRMNLFQK